MHAEYTKGSDRDDPLTKQTPGDFEAIDELVDEENANTSRKSTALNKFFSSPTPDHQGGDEDGSGSKDRLKIGSERVFNKPVKVFSKQNGRIKREIIERDVLNVFETLETQKATTT